MPSRKFDHVFWLLVVIHLVAASFGFSTLVLITKPLLMPVLAMLLLFSHITSKKLMVAGLFFSWLGDVLLLFASRNTLFFIAGLISFLTTHACYIILFLSVRSDQPSLLKKQPVYVLLVLLYGLGLVWLLFPFLGPLTIPVMVYATVICSMLLCSVHIYLKVNVPANRYYVAGALLFVISDSILAVNKFYQPFPLAGTWLMLSYCGAQYFIVWGFIEMRMKVK